MNKIAIVFAALAIACVSAGVPYANNGYQNIGSYVKPIQAAYIPAPAYGSSYGSHLAYAPVSGYSSLHPVSLKAAPSNPSAASSAAAASANLNAGHYNQLVVPSYNIVSGHPGYVPVNSYGSHY